MSFSVCGAQPKHGTPGEAVQHRAEGTIPSLTQGSTGPDAPQGAVGVCLAARPHRRICQRENQLGQRRGERQEMMAVQNSECFIVLKRCSTWQEKGLCGQKQSFQGKFLLLTRVLKAVFHEEKSYTKKHKKQRCPGFDAVFECEHCITCGYT